MTTLFSSVTNLYVSAGHDTISQSQNDHITIGGGYDSIVSSGGDTIQVGSNGNGHTIDGGNNLINLGGSDTIITGSLGYDTVNAGNTAGDNISLGGGNNSVYSRYNDTIRTGGDGNDTISTQLKNDLITLNGGNELVVCNYKNNFGTTAVSSSINGFVSSDQLDLTTLATAGLTEAALQSGMTFNAATGTETISFALYHTDNNTTTNYTVTLSGLTHALTESNFIITLT